MAYYDCDFKEVDILEVKSVSDMISAFKTSAADAAKLMGGDDIAVFSPRLGLMVVTSQYDLEEPVTTNRLLHAAPVIGAIYDTLREAGIGQGDAPAAILEPGCGTGNFMRLAPADLALDFHGVELDSISARIAQALCPEAHITAAGLEECRVSPASFDAAIGNVPYSGDIKIDGMPIHDYFIKKSVEAVRPGGIVAVLTSRYTLDKNSPAGWATSVPGAPAARSRPRPPTRSNTSSATAAFPMRSLAPSSPPAALSPTTARTTSRPSNPSPASRSSAPNARCTAAPRPGSRQSRTACASRAPSGRHRTPSSTCSASSGSSARMSA